MNANTRFKFSTLSSLSLPLCTLCSVLMTVGTASAQDLTIKSAPQSQPVIIFNATIHTVSGPSLTDGAIAFENGRITAVMNAEEWKNAGQAPRPGTKLIDANDAHIYPGLIGAYTQIGMTEIQAVRATIDMDEGASPISPEVRAATAVNPDSTLIPVTRSNGVLTVGVFPTGGVISGQVSAIRLEGWTTAELTISPSLGMAIRWPNTRAINAWWQDRSEEDQLRDIGNAMRTIADAFDAAESYARAKAADPAHPTDVRWEAMKPLLPVDRTHAAASELLVSKSATGRADTRARTFVIANDVDQITSAVAFAASRGLRLVIIGGRDADLCADLLKQHNIPVIIQGVHRLPRHDDAPYDEPYTLPARLHAAGVQFCIATNDDTAHERNLPYNAAMAAAHGLPMDAALKSVTLWPAQILGIDAEVGSLEVGKSAMLIMTSGNPLEVTTRVQRAYIDGRDIDLSNKHTKLDEKYRERYRQLGMLKTETEADKPAPTPAPAPAPTPAPQ